MWTDEELSLEYHYTHVYVLKENTFQVAFN